MECLKRIFNLGVYVFLNMAHPFNWDRVVNSATGDEELDSILSILDLESLETDALAGDWDVSKSDYLGPIPSDDVLMEPPAATKTDTRLPVALPLPINVVPELKPHYRLEDSCGSSIAPLQNKCTMVQEQGVFQSQSPVSVLESSTTSSTGKGSLAKSHISKRIRSRRARPLGINPWLLTAPLLPPSKRAYNALKKKQSQKKPFVMQAARQAMEQSSDKARTPSDLQNPGVVKKCSHCEVTKTPQWREGPMGPKTLCNACGVRYRSGRLFPEYRPAASPTFVLTLHSNSHKKVVEMRAKVKQPQPHEIKTEGVVMNSFS